MILKHLFFAFSIFLLSCNSDNDDKADTQSNNLSTTIVYNEINGVELNLLSLDIYYNELTENKKPVVIWVHGGGWGAGDKSNQIENKVDLFQSLDYVLVSVNYRLSPFPFELDNPDRLMYPNHNNDVADAIKWVVDNINQYGGDLDRIALLGHSAGAHLVSLTATNSSFLENVGLGLANIKGVAAIDTEGYDVLGRVEENNSLYINAFGVNTDSNLQASPIYTIESGVSYPNFFVAKRGSSETIAIADNFINTLESNGVFVSQIDGSIYDHNGINNAIGELNETLVTNALKDFFAVSFQ